MRGLDGKAFIVTGAGSGIGRACALRLAEEGARVLAVDRDEDKATETIRIGSGTKGTLSPFAQDLTENDALTHLVKEAIAQDAGVVHRDGRATGTRRHPHCRLHRGFGRGDSAR